MERGKKQQLRRVPLRKLVASVRKDVQRFVREAKKRKPKRQ